MLLAHTCTQVHWLSQPQPPSSGWIVRETNVSTYVYMTVEIALDSLHPPRPYPTHSHILTGPLVITTATPSLWLNRPRD
jgi:hypothetical protein